jgi:hypothetical protein
MTDGPTVAGRVAAAVLPRLPSWLYGVEDARFVSGQLAALAAAPAGTHGVEGRRTRGKLLAGLAALRLVLIGWFLQVWVLITVPFAGPHRAVAAGILLLVAFVAPIRAPALALALGALVVSDKAVGDVVFVAGMLVLQLIWVRCHVDVVQLDSGVRLRSPSLLFGIRRARSAAVA